MARKQDLRVSKHSLTRNFNEALDINDLKFMLGEFVSRLEDYLDIRLDLFYVNSALINPKIPLPTLKRGDGIFDFAIPDTVTVKIWDGKQFVTINLGTMSGFINLITQGIGSGINPDLFLRSDGADHWILSLVPLSSLDYTGLIAGYVPRFDGTKFVNSQIFDDGSDINVDTPGSILLGGSSYNGTIISIVDGGKTININAGTKFIVVSSDIELNSGGGIVQIGDIFGIGNSTAIKVDDSTKTITITSSSLTEINSAQIKFNQFTTNGLVKTTLGTGDIAVGPLNIDDVDEEIEARLNLAVIQ